MKKTVLQIFTLACVSITVVAALNTSPAISSSSGAPQSACTGCHGGPVNTDPSFVLSVFDTASLDDVTAYEPGKTYGVEVFMTKLGTTKFGFSLTKSAGTFAIASGDNSAQIASGGYATHTSSGTASGDGDIGWDILWTAPTSGTVNFQAYINATNNDGSDNGDIIYGKQLSISPLATGLPSVLSNMGMHIFPNPAYDVINIQYELKTSSELHITLFDLSGKRVVTLYNGKQTQGNQELILNTSELNKGIYLLQMNVGNEILTRKVIIQ
jgi:hypothetical protein